MTVKRTSPDIIWPGIIGDGFGLPALPWRPWNEQAGPGWRAWHLREGPWQRASGAVMADVVRDRATAAFPGRPFGAVVSRFAITISGAKHA